MGEDKVLVGATFENVFEDDKPDIEAAKEYLREWHEDFNEFEFVDAFSAVRVCRKGSYLPIVEKVNDKEWFFSGLGSKGLLYHAYYGRHLVNLLS